MDNHIPTVRELLRMTDRELRAAFRAALAAADAPEPGQKREAARRSVETIRRFLPKPGRN